MPKKRLPPPTPENYPRAPFTRWRCLWNPYLAIDPDKCEPFGKLVVVVDKAVGLSSPDFNGLANPYATLALNGEENPRKTSVQRQTLAPHFNDSFVIDIFHPMSILTVTVFDQEFGDSDFADVLGLDDVLAGWVDIRVGALPLNENVSCWFDLLDPTHFKETVTGRVKQPHPEGNPKCGRIHLKLFLVTSHPKDELFAMSLPLPDLGHACHLDLADLVHDVVSLSAAMDKWNVDIWADIEWALHHAVPVFFVAMVVIWKTETLLPALAILGTLALIYISTKFGEETEIPHGLGSGVRCGKGDNKDADAKGKDGDIPTSEDADAIVGGSSILSLLSPRTPRKPTSEDADAKAGGSSIMSPRKPTKAQVEEQKRAEAKKKAEEAEANLKSLVHLLPKHAAKELRKSAADMEKLVEFVALVEKLAKTRDGYGTQFLVIAGLAASIPASWLLWYFADSQVLLLRIIMTIFVSVKLWPYSFPGRMATGSFYYFLTHFRLRPKYQHNWEDDPANVEMRSLARAQVKHLGLKGRGKLHDDDIHKHGHNFELISFTQPHWCEDCGAFLTGVKEQGFRCRACNRVVCHDCAHNDADGADCPGVCKVHQCEEKTFHHATWCSKCNNFLWGATKQGMQCSVCSKIYCHKCVAGEGSPAPNGMTPVKSLHGKSD